MDLDIEKSEILTNECSENTGTNQESIFKKPLLLVGSRKQNCFKIKNLSKIESLDKPKVIEEKTSDCEQNINNKQEKKNDIQSETQASEEKPKNIGYMKDEVKEKLLTLPYREPSWGGISEHEYKFEVLKLGVITDTIVLKDKSFYVVGRIPICDIPMAHPTISRYHAIFQFRKESDEKNEKGLYLYDIDSTHGTFWNGNRIKSRMFVRLFDGHIVQFGCSKRKFIIHAPEIEPESELTVTELKMKRKLEIAEREKLEKQQMLEQEEMERLRKEKEENEGIDWGMGEDADEESDITENPYAQTNNEELFLNDPKKTLRGWFEREGLDMQYQTEEKKLGQFLCWIELPIDANKTVRAEALVTGKKKEAVIQCALEACRILDRYGLLRQANHEARKRKSRNWEEEDFYDSDDDNFLDRTGTVEKKRQLRMKLAGKLETQAETYSSLLEKHSMVTKKIAEIENLLAQHKRKQSELDNSNVDALDAFMSSLDSSVLDKTEIRKLKINLVNLRKEEIQLLKLINIAKPANLPPLKPHITTLTDECENKRKKLLTDEKNTNIKKNVKTIEANIADPLLQPHMKYVAEECEKKCVFEEKNISMDENVEISNEAVSSDQGKDEAKKKKKNLKRQQQREKKAADELQKGYDADAYRDDYSMWMPPENQSGDGKTSLNEKFGY